MSQITPAQQLFDLTGQVALVTGASSGLGRRFAEVLAAHGAKVVAAGRRTNRLKDLAASSPNIAALALDVTDTASIGPALDEAARAFGPLTLLVNNAGIASGGRIVDTPDAEWNRVMDTNVNAVWRLSRAFAQRLIGAKRPGAIINIASLVAGRVGMSSASYAISKAAVLHMTKAQAMEWARFGIRVNAISPGFISSEMTDDYLASPAGQEMIKRVPQRRSGHPSDLDATLLLLASPKASGFMTGAEINIDGGHALA
ncbi:MAG: SDR family oxidoreductase [Aestuariivirga sp.]|uniref:SDR family NAD(P)-dependent oxidoreductase n=1 Tax=Aestuariivirga sp. TaxID=2650926 RepID=UPI0025B8D153|nr:SDR family oxidoreductase [Aestuariivirga sp.]MCA3560198.1 SDR family oxidoreductase [Aestuariivirga sp.]